MIVEALMESDVQNLCDIDEYYVEWLDRQMYHAWAFEEDTNHAVLNEGDFSEQTIPPDFFEFLELLEGNGAFYTEFRFGYATIWWDSEKLDKVLNGPPPSPCSSYDSFADCYEHWHVNMFV